MHETTLPPGTSIGRHEQIGNEELYYVVEGIGEMTVDDETTVMEPGDVCLTKNGSYHSFRNIGNTDLRIIVIEALVPEKGK
jgi:mannose-6-phosphate isomerase-like protein (cupin superfamily)